MSSDARVAAPRSTWPARLAAGAGVAAAAVYGALKASWALGGTVGIRGVPPWATRTGEWADAGATVRFLAFEGTVALALIAIAVLLALVQPWGRHLPRTLVAGAAWLGCALIGGVWLAGTVRWVAGSGGPSADESLAPATFWTIWASFGVLGTAFGATAWMTRPAERRRRVLATTSPTESATGAASR